MSSSVGIGNSFLSSLYVQVNPGYESLVVENLRNSGHTNLYKILGQHDLLSLFDTTELDNPLLYPKTDGIISMSALSAYGFITKKEYSSPNAAQWLTGAPIIGFIYLELDKWLYTSDSGCKSGIHACELLINKLLETSSSLSVDIAIYGGFGKSELYVLIKTNRLEDIWKFTRVCRSITFKDCIEGFKEDDKDLPVFANTVTTPCFSYNNIKKNDVYEYTVSEIRGECRAAVNINCQSGFERYIKPYFDDEKEYNIKGTMGINDVVLYTIKNISTSKFIEDLLGFRSKWQLNNRGPINTTTTIIDTSEEELKVDVGLYNVIQDPLNIFYSSVLQENNPRLANRLKTFFNNINSYRTNRVYQGAVSKLSTFTEYLSQLIEEYQDKHNAFDNSQRFYAESRLLEAIEAAELGLSQRIESKINYTNSHITLPLNFGDGVFSNLIALEYLIDYIFSTWSDNVKTYKGRHASNGFPAYSDSFGFKVRFGETIFLPLASTFSPLSKEGNWLTLTHEISHALYTRYGIGEQLTEFYSSVIEKNFKDRKTEKKLGIDSIVHDQVYELFAHWYDYYHFYNCDIKEYTFNIWASWVLLPIVHENFIEYYFRSYVIFIMHSINELRVAYADGGETYRDFLEQQWGEHEKLVRTLSIDIAEGKYIEVNESRDDIKILFCKFAPILNKFYDKYRSDGFQKEINKQYQKLGVHVEEIVKGSIVLDDIPNPYILFKKIYQKDIRINELRASTALVISLKNKNYFLTTPIEK